jgi:hypothetical protein
MLTEYMSQLRRSFKLLVFIKEGNDSFKLYSLCNLDIFRFLGAYEKYEIRLFGVTGN